MVWRQSEDYFTYGFHLQIFALDTEGPIVDDSPFLKVFAKGAKGKPRFLVLTKNETLSRILSDFLQLDSLFTPLGIHIID